MVRHGVITRRRHGFRRGTVTPHSGRLGVRPAAWRVGRAGVTMLEMVLALLILGALAAVAIPRFAHSTIWEAEGQASAKEVVSALRFTRRRAIETGATRPEGCVFMANGSIYAAGETNQPVPLLQGELAEGWTFPSNPMVWFDALGAARGRTGESALWIEKGAAKWVISIDRTTGLIDYREE